MSTYKDRFYELRATKRILKQTVKTRRRTIKTLTSHKVDLLRARKVLLNLIGQTQDEIKVKIESLVTKALRTVFDRDFRFELRFEEKRNRMQCTPVITEGTRVYDDIAFDLGGGILPIISFALRVIFLSFNKNTLRNTIILDEPIKGSLGGELLDRTIAMYKAISEKAGIQLILITHYKQAAEVADRVFKITYKNGRSYVKER